LTRAATAESYAVALEKMTGVPVAVRHVADYSEVYWTPQNVPAARSWLNRQLSPGKPGDVRVDFGPVVYPVATRRALPFVVGLLLAGYVAGKLL
jgi:hypothetical protein